jgi:hypothetical protein
VLHRLTESEVDPQGKGRHELGETDPAGEGRACLGRAAPIDMLGRLLASATIPPEGGAGLILGAPAVSSRHRALLKEPPS